MAAMLHDACDVLIQFFFPFRRNKRLPVLNRKDDLNIELRKYVSHS